MFKINIRAIKFEEITVTFHPIKPKNNHYNHRNVHPNNGITTHFIFLKIIQSVNYKRKTPIPKKQQYHFLYMTSYHPRS